MTVSIIADSAADLPKSLIEQYGIEVLPLSVSDAAGQYSDGGTLQPKTLFERMREGHVYKTAQVSIDQFRKAFTKLAVEGRSGVYVAFSSGISGTYQTSLLVRDMVQEEYPDLDLRIVDTKCASVGCGLVVVKAAEAALAGKNADEVAETAEYAAQHMEHIFTVDNLEYLYRGGRVSKTSAFIGGLLNIKPVLHMEDGKLVPLEKIRGKSKVLGRMVELMEKRGAADLKDQTIGISHGDDPEAAETLERMIREKFGCDKFVTNMIGGAIGAHAGPGTLALFFYNEQLS
ncbi:DegV family protein [Paenibacillus gansuensis]|uniref:DegV family protein n=1 Tax=Paenibacillus gansuensis TaxID=306542 RepID=A0ABW5PBV2_9BACL